MQIFSTNVAILFVSFFSVTRSKYCDGLTHCMIKLGAHVKEAVIDVKKLDKENLEKFYTTVCRDIDDLVRCYNPQNIPGCSAFQSFVQFVPSKHALRKQFIELCSEIEEMVLAAECYNQKGVKEGLEQCFIVMMSDFHLSESDPEYKGTQCSAMSAFNSCTLQLITGKCKTETINFVTTTSGNHFNTICSASMKLSNNFFLSLIFILLRIFSIL
ncbi:uncharacterized protein LOC127714946 [Mytilus californianus]|uniref:uncharacterized protein LOC127714946 n=1 Tax=Mytilus californianus TaxID=6549 RepID=UPI0022478DE5|nr:uncharacterized protein LOC127714946 [Mytilus californianus]